MIGYRKLIVIGAIFVTGVVLRYFNLLDGNAVKFLLGIAGIYTGGNALAKFGPKYE